MTNEEKEAGDFAVGAGRYNGRPLWWILDEDPDYFAWMMRTAWDGKMGRCLHLYGNCSSTQAKLENAVHIEKEKE